MAHGVFKVILLVFYLCVLCLSEAASQQQGAFEPQSSAKHERREHCHCPSMPIESYEKQQGRFPYMCSILQKGSRSYICSGFLIRPQWVVTAASCVDPTIHDFGLDPLVYCDANGKDGVKMEKFFVGKGVMHPVWNGDYKKGFDIALVELDRKTNLVLPKFNKRAVFASSGKKLTALGRGKGTKGDRLDSPVDSMTVSYITPKDCEGQYTFRVTDHMICAGTGKNDTLKGDAGGPLLILDRGDRIEEGFAHLDFVTGIASGHTSTDLNTATIYTSIAHFWSWIEHVIDGKPLSSKELFRPTPFLGPQQGEHRYAELSAKDMETVLKTVIAKIESDYASAVRQYLREGLNPDSVYGSDRYTLLHWAAINNSPDCVEVLIQFGARVDARDKFKRTPLFTAAYYGHVSTVKILLAHGADIDAPDKSEYTPLSFACLQSRWNGAEFLIDKGANVQTRNIWGLTPLHHASQNGGVLVVKLLLLNGAEVDARDIHGWTSLWIVAFYASSSNVQTAKALLDAGASKTAKARSRGIPYDVVCGSSGCSNAYKKQLRDLLNPTSSLLNKQSSVAYTIRLH